MHRLGRQTAATECADPALTPKHSHPKMRAQQKPTHLDRDTHAKKRSRQ